MDADTVRAWVTGLQDLDRTLDDPARIDLIRALEELKCAAEGAQAVTTADFDASQRAVQAARGVPAARQGQGIAAQVALARRESPHRGQQHLQLATLLPRELPHTRTALVGGHITEHKAMLIARESACLTLEDRLKIDQRVAADPDHLGSLGDRALIAEIHRHAYRLDPHSVVERRRRAEHERRVTLRPAPDVMTHLSALLPVKQGVAVLAVLGREADRLRAAGDERSRGQIMADTLVRRVLTSVDAGGGREPAVMVNLVVSDEVLWGGSNEAAHLDGYGPIPGDLARELAAGDQVWLRRLYASPATGSLVAMDSRARRVPAGMRTLIRLRDQTCRTPWCDAPIRHGDHVRSAADEGPTSEVNTQGLCEACNYAKQAAGWSARPRPGPRHTTVTTTPTGHTYDSTAPPVTTPHYVPAGPGRWTLVA